MARTRSMLLFTAAGLTLAAVAVALAGGDAATPPPVAPATGQAPSAAVARAALSGRDRGAGAGAVRGYDYSLVWDTELELAADGGNPSVQRSRRELRGRMVWSVLERRGADLVCAVRFPATEVRGTIDGRQVGDDHLGIELARPTLVLRSVRGQTLGYRFDPELAVENRDIVRMLVSACRVVLPAGGGSSWETREVDPSGSYRAAYGVVRPALAERGPRLRKTKLAPGPGDAAGNTPPLSEHRCEAWLDLEAAATPWVAEASYHETMVGRIEELGSRVTVTTTASFQRRDEGGDDVERAVVPGSDVVWASLDGADEIESDDEATAPGDDAIDLASAMQELNEILAAGRLDPMRRIDLLDRLAERIARDPAFLAEITHWLDSGVSDDIATFLLAALGAADTEAAAQQLAARVGDAAAPAERRTAAAIAAGQLTRVDAGLRRSLRSAYQEPDASPQLRSAAMLALGAVSRSPRGGGDALQDLLDYESEALRRGELALWFEALANTDAPAALDKLAEYTGHPDDEVRRSATGSAGRMSLGDVAAVLRERTGDPAPRVRAAAGAGLAARLDVSLLEPVGALSRDPDVSVRAAVLAGLARRLPGDARARALLAEMAGGDPAEALRKAAAKALRKAPQ